MFFTKTTDKEFDQKVRRAVLQNKCKKLPTSNKTT